MKSYRPRGGPQPQQQQQEAKERGQLWADRATGLCQPGRSRRQGRRARSTGCAAADGVAAGRPSVAAGSSAGCSSTGAAPATAARSTARGGRSRAVDPESLVLLRILAQLQLEVVTLVRRTVTFRRRVPDQSADRDDGDHPGLLAAAVMPGGAATGRVHLLLAPGWRPAINGKDPGGVSQIGAPAGDVGASQMRGHLMA